MIIYRIQSRLKLLSKCSGNSKRDGSLLQHQGAVPLKNSELTMAGKTGAQVARLWFSDALRSGPPHLLISRLSRSGNEPSGLLVLQNPGSALILNISKQKSAGSPALLFRLPFSRAYLILVSLNSTCLRTTGSYLRNTSLSVLVREFFLVT